MHQQQQVSGGWRLHSQGTDPGACWDGWRSNDGRYLRCWGKLIKSWCGFQLGGFEFTQTETSLRKPKKGGVSRSFTYSSPELLEYINNYSKECEVYRSDAVTLDIRFIQTLHVCLQCCTITLKCCPSALESSSGKLQLDANLSTVCICRTAHGWSPLERD